MKKIFKGCGYIFLIVCFWVLLVVAALMITTAETVIVKDFFDFIAIKMLQGTINNNLLIMVSTTITLLINGFFFVDSLRKK